MKTLSYPLLMTLGTALAFAATPAPVDFHDHIGLQLWSLRDMTKTDQPGALDLVKSYGIKEIETAGFNGLSAADYLKLCQTRGITPVCGHFGYDDLGKDLDKAISDAKALGVHYVCVAWIPHGEGALTSEVAHQAAANFNKWGAAFRAAGLRLGYHPHGYEFLPDATEGGRTGFDILMQETKAENLFLEMDVFWIYHAEQDPVKMLKQYPDRWLMMHVKDIRKGAPRDVTHGASAPATDNVAVGDGQIDWKAVLGTAQSLGVKYYFIEDETPSPLTCIPASLKYLRGLKL